MGPDGRMQGTALIVLDISARRRAQRMLERFVEHAPNVIAVKDLDGRYLMFSAHGAEIVRQRPGGPHRPHRPRDLRRRLRRRSSRPRIGRSCAEGRPLTFENTWATRDGGTLTLRHDQVPAPRPGRRARGARRDRRRGDRDPARRDRPHAARRARPGRAGRDHRARPRRPDRDLEPGRRADVRARRPSDAIGRSYVELLVPARRARAASTRHRQQGPRRADARPCRSLPAARRRHALPGADLDRPADAARRQLARHAGDDPRHHRPRAGRGGAARARGRARALQRRPRALRVRRQPRPAGAAELDPAQRRRGDRGRQGAPGRRRARADGAHRRRRHRGSAGRCAG